MDFRYGSFQYLWLVLLCCSIFVGPTEATEAIWTSKPVLTSADFDKRASKLMFDPAAEGEGAIVLGTVFFVHDNGRFMYLVSAGHVFREAMTQVLNQPGRVVTQQIFLEENGKQRAVGLYELDLLKEYGRGNLRFHVDPDVDIGVLRLRPYLHSSGKSPNQEPENPSNNSQSSQEIAFGSRSVNVLDKTSVMTYEELEKAGELYFFGFPSLLGSGILDSKHPFEPIIRKGIVAKLLDKKRILMDGFVSGGSSGSPVFLRVDESDQNGNGRLRLCLVGLVKGYPFAKEKRIEKNPDEIRITLNDANVGLSLVESVDNILLVLQSFPSDQDTNVAQTEKSTPTILNPNVVPIVE